MKKSIKVIFKELLPYVLIVIVVLFIKMYIVSPIRVNGESMYSTLHDGDIMLLDEASYRFSDIERFDIVVIKYNDEYLIKRVIGLPGEIVSCKDNTIYIDGKKVKENFKHAKTSDFDDVKISDDEYFVLGDNRVNSIDSRMIGNIKKDLIKGKSSFTLFPFSRFGKKN